MDIMQMRNIRISYIFNHFQILIPPEEYVRCKTIEITIKLYSICVRQFGGKFIKMTMTCPVVSKNVVTFQSHF